MYASTAIAAALLGAAAATTGLTVDETAASPSTNATKAIESDKFRMVVLAGLEGSGHHYMLAAASRYPGIDETYHPDNNPYFLPVFMANGLSNYAHAEETAKEEMSRLKDYTAALPPPGRVYVHNSWSYPTDNGPHKVMQYLDMKRMADVAEDCGVDLRVLYLRRSAKDLLVANTVHRKFQK